MCVEQGRNWGEHEDGRERKEMNSFGTRPTWIWILAEWAVNWGKLLNLLESHIEVGPKDSNVVELVKDRIRHFM